MSTFLERRYPKAVAAFKGPETVSYYKYLGGTPDPITNVVDESTAYSTTAIALSAIVKFNPDRATRDRLGIEIDIEAVLEFAAKELMDNGITLKYGDAFILPGQTERRYVITQPAQTKQVGKNFLGWMVAVRRRVGRR